MVRPLRRIRKLWMVMVSRLGRRVLEARLKPVPVGVEMRLRAVGKDLERRQQRPFRLDHALQREVAEGPAVVRSHGNRPQGARTGAYRM